MTKQYLILKLETIEKDIPSYLDMTTRTEYLGVTTGYQIPFDTLEEAEQDLERQIKQDKEYTVYTIIPIYS